jgi:pSer/pThr/pTyr-binding forkhead associated (FHA) protein
MPLHQSQRWLALDNQIGTPPQPSTDTATPQTSVPDEVDVDALLLAVKRGPNAGSRWLLTPRDVTSAGRHPDGDIQDNVTVSRRHAEFRFEGGDFVVVDLGRINGTYVNREPVESAVLFNDDEVQIGTFRLMFHAAGQPTG